MTSTVLAWGPAALWAAVLFLLSSLPEVPGAARVAVNDKVAHLVLYTVLGLTLAWTRRRPARGSGPSHRALLLAGIAYGASDEIHQIFVPGRTPSLADWGADIIGVALGYALGVTLLTRSTDARRA